MQNKTEILSPNTFYHIYNRANGNENIFTEHGNYLFFLNKYKQYISPICNTYCYCLMPNHFYFQVEIKTENELIAFFQKEKPNLNLLTGSLSQTFSKFETLEKLISKQFANFFSSYTQAFNKQQKRKGSLFIKNFKRKKITSKEYLYKLVHYIHYNPVDAGLCNNIYGWKYSSCAAICSNSKTLIQKEKVIEWFDDLDNFKFIHKQRPKELDIVFD